MPAAAPLSPARFITADVVVRAHADLSALAQALSDSDGLAQLHVGLSQTAFQHSEQAVAPPHEQVLVLHDVRGHTEADTLIAHWCHWLEQLPPAARACWDTADSRTLDLGLASGHGGGAPLEVVLHPSRLAALAALGACLQVTVYPWPPG